MEKSRDATPEKPDEQTPENGITNDKEDEIVNEPAENATRGSNGEGSCALSPDEIKQIVANFLATMSAEGSVKGPSGEVKMSSESIFRTPTGKESVDDGVLEFARGESSKYKSRFSRFSSRKKKKASGKLSRRKSSKSNSRKNKTVHLEEGSGNLVPDTNAKKYNSTGHASFSKERRRKNKKRSREDAHDVYSKLRKQVRYVLNKITYEQSLIDAYGGEGWKGMSVDKLKPVQELQRASSEILRCKLRLRDLFQYLDTLCAEGAYPISMFDSEGLLDSEDIYCTICGSKELSPDNDIVLCDGECNRAFHQLCLKPPLLTEEIPPEDQGWLCPGCDCKFDCIELLNDFFGSDLSMKDNWMRVFPEAAATAANSNNIDELLTLPSDDSEDDDFNPDSMDVDDKDKSGEGGESCEGEESSSDDSDFSSASEDLGDFINKELVGNPTEDLEEEDEDDDDYDPDLPEADDMDVNGKIDVEKSGDRGESSEGEGSASDESDFSSASEDLGDFASKRLVGNSLDNSAEEGDDNGPEPDHHNEENSEPLVLEMEQKSLASGSKKRDTERLDYKKLYDETYQNAPSDSSDDEEWSEFAPSRKRKNLTKGDGSTVVTNNKRRSEHDEQPTNAETKLKEAEGVTSRQSGKKSKSSSENSSTANSSRKGLGETAMQKLREVFQNNHYPDRAVKEGLAKDLGISYLKVDKWFGNARWSFNHPLHARTVSKGNISTKSPSQIKLGTQIASSPNNSSGDHSTQNLSEAKTTVSNTPIKIASPLNHRDDSQRKKLCSPNSSVADTTIPGETSKIPAQPIRRRSLRRQDNCTDDANEDDANKGSTDNAERRSTVTGEGSRRKGNTPTQNTKQIGKKATSNAKK